MLDREEVRFMLLAGVEEGGGRNDGINGSLLLLTTIIAIIEYSISIYFSPRLIWGSWTESC